MKTTIEFREGFYSKYYIEVHKELVPVFNPKEDEMSLINRNMEVEFTFSSISMLRKVTWESE